ncbi:MAG TPA: lysophospholipid acyltransferase family protein [Thermoanaerobaculia bacterium]|nr:lysophospholipid acyltransferase family protein [Thermoanaerobaculia bacterium]
MRAVLRLLGVAGATLLAYGSILLALPFLFALPRARARWQDLWMWTWSRMLLALFAVRVRVVGTPPARPAVLASNHLSYLDIPLLGAFAPCVFVAKGEIGGWPFAGAVCRAVNTVFIDRTLKRDIPRSLEAIAGLVARGQRVVVFPEATSSSGARVLPFRSALLELPLCLGLPVHPVAISYATSDDVPPAYLTICWWGSMPLAPHVWELAALDRIEATLVFGPPESGGGDRKTVAARLQSAVAAAFKPMPQPAWPEDDGKGEGAANGLDPEGEP